MKKVFTLVALAGMFTFVACGPSAEEIAKIEKAKQDSIAAVESQKAAEEAARIEAEAKAKASADSAAAAAEAAAKAAEEEAAKSKKGGKTTKPATTPAKAEPVKAGQGRG